MFLHSTASLFLICIGVLLFGLLCYIIQRANFIVDQLTEAQYQTIRRLQETQTQTLLQTQTTSNPNPNQP